MLSKFLLFILSFVLVVFAISGVKAAGDVDTSFKATAYANDGTALSKIAVQPDGKVLVAGGFTVANGVPVTSIVRLNADGTVDTSFVPPIFVGFAGPRLGGYITDVGIQSDGKIVVVGQFIIGNNANRNIARLNTNGSLDTTFADLTAQFASGGSPRRITINPDNSIYIVGSFTLSNGTTNIAKLNSNGTIDSNTVFPGNIGNVVSIIIQNDGKILSSGTKLLRFSPNGSADSQFPTITINSDGAITKTFVQADGKIVIVGAFTTVNGFTQGNISRLNVDGSIDTTFNPSGIGSSNTITDILATPDGKFLITGSFISYNNSPRRYAAKLNADGTLDNSFTLDPVISTNSTVFSPVVLSDGRILIGASAGRNVYRLLSNGTIDSTFRKTTVGRGGTVYDIVQQPDGKILATGFISVANEVGLINIVRYNLDGSLDTTFNAYAGTFNRFMKLAVQPDGKIFVVGSSSGQGIGDRPYRLNSDGTLDTSFNSSAPNTGDVKVLSDGKILLGATRVTATGGSDGTFSIPTLNGSVYANEVQTDGKYLIAGGFTQVNGAARGRIARLNNDGTLDTTFNPPLGATGDIYDIEVQADGKVIIVGGFTGLNGASRSYIGRLNSDGSLDTSFTAATSNEIRSVKIQPDGKILIAGLFAAVNQVPRNRYARLNADGSLDTSFIVNGNSDVTAEEVDKITLQSDGKILIGGYFARVRNVGAANIARLLNNAGGKTPFDFDGDGRADVSVFRPSTGYWYTSQNPAVNYGAIQFGVSTDKLVPADYDGDGKTDVAVVRNGNWYIQRSSQGFSGTQFGDSNDVPVPADYDGDGKADIAVFRPSNGTWYLLQSTAGFSAIALGLGTDKPVPGDYNGDGKAEVAVFRPSNGYWYLSTNPATGYGGVQFGAAEDKPVPADYDGDGKTDLAVFRPSNGSWYLLQSTAGFTGLAFGFGTDIPVPADYDGDGKADIAVFRSGNWYLNRSSQGFTGIQFGTATDAPIPNSFVR